MSLKNENQTFKKFTWVHIYIYIYISSTGFLKEEYLEKKFKIGNKGNRKDIFIFWKIKDQKKWEKRGETKENNRTNIRKETK